MSFLEALHDRVLVCDGAMGSELYDRGVFVNQSFEALNLTRPELVVEVHRAYVEAGADVIETNTFGANRMKLPGFGLADRLAQINIAGVRLARQTAGASGYVAGSIGPLGVRVGAGGSTTVETAESHFAEQATALLEGGVDLLLLETFGQVAETRGSSPRRPTTVRAAGRCADGDGRGGAESRRCAPRAVRPDPVGPRRDSGRRELRCRPCRDARNGRAYGGGDRCAALGAAERGGPKEVEGRRLVLSSPEFLASYARRYVAVGVGLVGGCCGTTPAHIARIKQAVAVLPAPARSPVVA